MEQHVFPGKTRSNFTLEAVNKKKKKKTRLEFLSSHFEDFYELDQDLLGAGTFSRVESCHKKGSSSDLFAVKIIDKIDGIFNRSKVLKEIETYHLCHNHPNIVQLLEYFESPKAFYLVFEKLEGGPLLKILQCKKFVSEKNACFIVRDLAK